MDRKLLFLLLLSAIMVYFIYNGDTSDSIKRYFSGVISGMEKTAFYNNLVNRYKMVFGRITQRPEDETREKGEEPEFETETTINEIREYRPPLRFQGLLREDGVTYAMINGELYAEGDFINNNRLVRIESDYIIVQGRTRRFRYNLQ